MNGYINLLDIAKVNEIYDYCNYNHKKKQLDLKKRHLDNSQRQQRTAHSEFRMGGSLLSLSAICRPIGLFF